MNILKATLMATMLVSSVAGATGLPPVDFSKWASKVLNDDGVTDARIAETKYPFSFTYCRKGSSTLWRYDVMSSEQLDAVREGKTLKPVPAAQKSVVVESDSSSCKVES